MTNEQIAEWVTQRIDQSIRENLPREILIYSSRLKIEVRSPRVFDRSATSLESETSS